MIIDVRATRDIILKYVCDTREVDKNWVHYACTPPAHKNFWTSAHLMTSSILHICYVSISSEEFAENIKESFCLDIQHSAYNRVWHFVMFSCYFHHVHTFCDHFELYIFCDICYVFVSFSCCFHHMYIFLWPFCVSHLRRDLVQNVTFSWYFVTRNRDIWTQLSIPHTRIYDIFVSFSSHTHFVWLYCVFFVVVTFCYISVSSHFRHIYTLYYHSVFPIWGEILCNCNVFVIFRNIESWHMDTIVDTHTHIYDILLRFRDFCVFFVTLTLLWPFCVFHMRRYLVQNVTFSWYFVTRNRDIRTQFTQWWLSACESSVKVLISLYALHVSKRVSSYQSHDKSVCAVCWQGNHQSKWLHVCAHWISKDEFPNPWIIFLKKWDDL